MLAGEPSPKDENQTEDAEGDSSSTNESKTMSTESNSNNDCGDFMMFFLCLSLICFVPLNIVYI